MTAIEARPDRLLPPAWRPHQEVAWWAMVLLCMSEGALFAYFVVAYFYLGLQSPAWPPPGIEKPKLALPLVMTALLLSSSVVLIVGERQREHGKRGRHRACTTITVLLGLGFLALQVREYSEKLQHMRPQSNAYASTFYTITSFHGMHVAFGLLLLLWMLLREVRGRVDPERPVAIKVTSLYWHFVDAVWLVILTTLYLSPHMY